MYLPTINVGQVGRILQAIAGVFLPVSFFLSRSIYLSIYLSPNQYDACHLSLIISLISEKGRTDLEKACYATIKPKELCILYINVIISS